jgi:para-nitrobenzyl esterase
MRGRVRAARATVCAGLIATVVAGGSSASTASAHGNGHQHGGDPAVVRTQEGRVRGVAHATYREFSGVPYATPPVGQLRWKPPRPHAPWHGVLDATQLPVDCAQPTSWDQATNTTVQVTNEDCLRLNVITPASVPHGHKLPVLVFIHGGAFTGGGGRYFDPSQLAADGRMVVVTINYRLGVLGFLDHPALDGPGHGGAEGNYGLMDQQLALKWVARNVKGFGGDPHRVTIAGESAGGGAVCAQLTSPAARGLIDGAIMESLWNPRCRFAERAAAETQGAQIAEKVGCGNAADVAACLRATPVADLLRAQAGLLWRPVVGGSRARRSPMATTIAFRC